MKPAGFRAILVVFAIALALLPLGSVFAFDFKPNGEVLPDTSWITEKIDVSYSDPALSVSESLSALRGENLIAPEVQSTRVLSEITVVEPSYSASIRVVSLDFSLTRIIVRTSDPSQSISVAPRQYYFVSVPISASKHDTRAVTPGAVEFFPYFGQRLRSSPEKSAMLFFSQPVSNSHLSSLATVVLIC